MDGPEDIACYCNHVRWTTVDQAIRDGARTLPQLYDRSQAGNGPCGGSCRDSLAKRIKELSSLPASAENKSASSELPPTALVKAVSLFNRRYYWETHEVLEEAWLDEQGSDRLFLQGLIQASAALYHVLNANPKGALKLAEDAANKLEAYRPSRYGLALDPLIETLRFYAHQSREILGRAITGFDYDRLPMLTLGRLMRKDTHL